MTSAVPPGDGSRVRSAGEAGLPGIELWPGPFLPRGGTATAAVRVGSVVLALAGTAALLRIPSVDPILLIAGVGALVLLAVSIEWPSALIWAVLLPAPFMGLVRRIGSSEIAGGAISLSGLRWVALTGLLVFLLATRLRPIVLPRPQVLLLGFAGWLGAVCLLRGASLSGYTSVLFHLLPPLTAVYAASRQWRYPALASRVAWFFVASIAAAVVVYAISFPAGVVRWTQDGPKGLFPPRVMATYLAIALAVTLAWRRYEADRRVRQLLLVASCVAFATIGFTASRMAILIAIVLFAVSGVRPDRWRRLLPRLAGAAAITLLVLFSVPQLRERIFVPPRPNGEVSKPRFDWTGRDRIWTALGPGIRAHPFFGSGMGSAKRAAAAAMRPGRHDRAGEYHVHNEYLEILHDTGLVGLALFLSVYGSLAVAHLRRWRRADAEGAGDSARWHLAALLGLAVVLLSALVDNTFHYPTVTSPLFVVLGLAAAGGEGADRELRREASSA